MNKEELVELADKLGIKHYNECEERICLSGINGHATVLYTDKAYERVNWQKPAEMIDFANHLKQMGRDSLKFDMNELIK
jgi:hypothetical protein